MSVPNGLEKQPRIRTGGSSYRLAPDVFLIAQDGLSRLLDFERGRFYGLDETATEALNAILDSGPEEAAACVAASYGVSAEQVRADVRDLLASLQRAQLLLPPESYHDSVPARPSVMARWLGWRVRRLCRRLRHRHGVEARPSVCPPSARDARRLLWLAWLSLRLVGWSHSLTLWRQAHPPTDDAPGADRIMSAVDTLVREGASQSFLLPLVCKERALAGYQLLRGVYGLPAEIVIGIERHPFRAHAWVECHGAVVTDDVSHCETFTPVARFS